MLPVYPNTRTNELIKILNQWYSVLFNLGTGLPEQGLAGQVLTKIDGVSYNTHWAAIGASIPTVTIVPNVIANYNAIAGDLILANTVAGGFNIKLPLAIANGALFIRVKKISADFNTLSIINSGADTIDGTTPLNIILPLTAVTFVSDGVATWWIV